MILIEFLAPIKSSIRDRILGILYFEQRYNNVTALTVDQIRQRLRASRTARWAKINVADVLAKSGHYVDSPRTEGNRRIWTLTDSGTKKVRELLHLPETEPEIEHDVGTLTATAAKIRDPEVQDYVNEAIKCLQVGALRAAVVFLWTGAIRTLQHKMMSHGGAAVTAALQTHDLKARKVTRVDDFAHVKDKTVLLAAKDLGVLDKGEKDSLEEALNLRNRCGHPGNYKPGEKKVSGFAEDLITIVFS